MKSQYCGDVNDYRKYGLLRGLQKGAGLRLLVAWMLTPNDAGRDGGKVSYLDAPSKWRKHDPDLFDGIRDLMAGGSERNVALVESSGLLPETRFYSAEVPDGRDCRHTWRHGLLDALSGIDLVFFDPDNGIEVHSKPVGRKGS